MVYLAFSDFLQNSVEGFYHVVVIIFMKVMVMMVLMTMVIYNDDDDEDGGDKVEWKKDSFPFHLLRPSTNSPNTDTSPTLKIQNIFLKNILENCRRETICQNFYLCWEGK